MLEASCRGMDVTLDTNVLVHAENIAVSQQASSLRVLEWMRDRKGEVKWVMDDQGKAAPDPATSVLYSEYMRHLKPQGLGLVLFIEFLKSQRVSWSQRPGHATQRRLCLHVSQNKCDRAVLGAAYGSESKVLVTNDYEDFSVATRKAIKKDLHVTIVCSDQAIPDAAAVIR